uniref:SWIM-type domain-containing protein n=1 Tax=Noccaea caerulescens TaxID=107243 RepID=A0A1J3H9G1_NOCCA
MVKTFTGRRGGRTKIPVRRQPLSEVQPEISTATETERTNSNVGEEARGVCEEEITNMVEACEEQRSREEEEGFEVETEGEKNGNEEEDVESSDNTSVEGDDCEVIVEDRAGYKELEPSLRSNDDGDFFEVEVCEDAHFVEAGCEDANAEYDSDDIGHDMWDDEHIPDPLSDNDCEEEDHNRQFNSGSDELLALGKTFNNAGEFKYAVLMYSLKTQYDITFYKSSVDRLGVRCTQHIEEKCPWRVYCSFERGRNKLMVKVFINNHICVRSGYTKLLKSGAIALLWEERLRLNHKIKSQDMVDEIKREHNMIVTLSQCRRAKTLLSRRRKACHEAHFARIWDYQEEVRESNSGSTMEIETIPGPVPGGKQRFHRLYVCFEALKSSWKQSCRPIIGLDAAFMKWDVKGQMLAAVGRDGDNRIFPIAWAVVEVEDNPNWLWFVQLLKTDLGLEDGADITIISDKHKGILAAVHEELPKAEHRMCARHILENWKKTNKDIELERKFWKIARSYTVEDFESNLEALKNYNQGAYDSLQCTQPKTWSRPFFKLGSCCNDNLNNLSESFNRSVREARRKPLLDMLTDVRRQCMVRNAKRALITGRWKMRFTPRSDKEIELNRQKAKECKRYMSTGNLHEVDFNGTGYSVDMEKKTCGCGYWQMNGIPCMHAMCVITTTRLDLNDYVSDYYLTSRWRELYVRGMKPVQGMKLWRRLGRLPVLPPPSRANKGRPHDRARRKGPHESSSNSCKLTRHGRV